jgi:hypothetical protein
LPINRGTGAGLKTRKKRKFKKRYWLLIDLAVAIVIFALLLYKPARYKPPDAILAGNNQREVSPYLTNVLLPQLHNGAQRDEPFEMVVTQKGINEIIAWSQWPKESDGVTFTAPVVYFAPDSIELEGTANWKVVDLVITVVAEPRLDEEGLLNLHVAKVKIGAMNITPVARMIAKRMYAERLSTMPIDTEDLRTQIAASLLNNEPFEPVFDIADIFENEKKKLRIEKITIMQEKLVLRLVPAS